MNHRSALLSLFLLAGPSSWLLLAKDEPQPAALGKDRSEVQFFFYKSLTLQTGTYDEWTYLAIERDQKASFNQAGAIADNASASKDIKLSKAQLIKIRLWIDKAATALKRGRIAEVKKPFAFFALYADPARQESEKLALLSIVKGDVIECIIMYKGDEKWIENCFGVILAKEKHTNWTTNPFGALNAPYKPQSLE